MGHKRRFDGTQLSKRLPGAGFKVQRVYALTKIAPPPWWFSRKLPAGAGALVAAMLRGGAGNPACSRLSGGPCLRLRSIVGQDVILRAGWQPALYGPFYKPPQAGYPMRAVALDFEHRRLLEREVPTPQFAQDDQVLFRVDEVGVCGTDRELASFHLGYPPEGESFLVMGHEACGRVIEVGPAVTSLRPGDCVVPMIRRDCRPPCPC